jgi:hypothetical protein
MNLDALIQDFNTLGINETPLPGAYHRPTLQNLPKTTTQSAPSPSETTNLSKAKNSERSTPSENAERMRIRRSNGVTSRIAKGRDSAIRGNIRKRRSIRVHSNLARATRKEKVETLLRDVAVRSKIYDRFYTALAEKFDGKVPREIIVRQWKYWRLDNGVIRGISTKHRVLLSREDIPEALGMGKRRGEGGVGGGCRCAEGTGCRSDKVMEGLDELMKGMEV